MAKEHHKNEPDRKGDVLGISDADPNVEIPKPADKGSGHARGIDVRRRQTGLGDVPQRDGASGVDMGGGGEGTDIDRGR